MRQHHASNGLSFQSLPFDEHLKEGIFLIEGTNNRSTKSTQETSKLSVVEFKKPIYSYPYQL